MRVWKKIEPSLKQIKLPLKKNNKNHDGNFRREQQRNSGSIEKVLELLNARGTIGINLVSSILNSVKPKNLCQFNRVKYPNSNSVNNLLISETILVNF